MFRYISLPLVFFSAIVFATGVFGQPMSGSYDINGGQNHFPTIIAAVDTLTYRGIGGALTFNVYTGVYYGQVDISNSIPGMNAGYPLVIQAAPGESPVVTDTSEYADGFFIANVANVTIRNMEIANCSSSGIRFFDFTSATGRCVIEGNYIHDNSQRILHEGAIWLQYGADHRVIGNEVEGNYYGISLLCTKRAVIVNNLVYNQHACCIRDSRGDSTKILYNSVYMPGTFGANSNGIYLHRPIDTVIKNNNIYNAGIGPNHRALVIQSPAFEYSFFSDYNNFYTPNGIIAYLDGDYNTIQSWFKATRCDFHSISVDPLYFSTATDSFDLHIHSNSPLVGAGAPLSAVSVDYDGETRHPVTPTIGADETGGNLLITLTPINSPIAIPAGGGNFSFSTQAANPTPVNYTLDVWSEVILPRGAARSPLILREGMMVAAGDTVVRRFTQSLPGSAPPGIYSYVIKAGVYPDSVISSDRFRFIKLREQGDDEVHNNWTVTGWFDDNDSPPAPTDTMWQPYSNLQRNVETLTGDNGCLGVTYDGSYIWVSGRSIAPNPNMMYIINAEGTQLMTHFPTGSTSAWGMRDMTSDGTYIYGCWDGGITKYDPAPLPSQPANNLGTMPNPGGMQYIRAIAYDPIGNNGQGSFYCSNLDYIFEIGVGGTLLRILGSPPPNDRPYGLAFDYDDPAGPWLWLAASEMVQLDPVTGTFTGVRVNIAPYYSAGSLPGGCDYIRDWNPGYSSIIALRQGFPDQINIFAMHQLIPLAITATLHNYPVAIPAAGGEFTFSALVENIDNSAANFDAWSEVVLPNDSTYGPLILRRSLLIPPNAAIIREIVQNVPGNAPRGTYTYMCYIGAYPDLIFNYDSFSFCKIIFDSLPAQNRCWAVNGWFGDEKTQIENQKSEIASLTISPNPFNVSSFISFKLQAASQIKLSLFDVTGREVARLAEGCYPAGTHRAVWDGSKVASGVYFARLEAGGTLHTQKLLLLK